MSTYPAVGLAVERTMDEGADVTRLPLELQ